MYILPPLSLCGLCWGELYLYVYYEVISSLQYRLLMLYGGKYNGQLQSMKKLRPYCVQL